jgi:hypothetical protein
MRAHSTNRQKFVRDRIEQRRLEEDTLDSPRQTAQIRLKYVLADEKIFDWRDDCSGFLCTTPWIGGRQVKDYVVDFIRRSCKTPGGRARRRSRVPSQGCRPQLKPPHGPGERRRRKSSGRPVETIQIDAALIRVVIGSFHFLGIAAVSYMQNRFDNR